MLIFCFENFQLESDVCRLPYTWSLNSLFWVKLLPHYFSKSHWVYRAEILRNSWNDLAVAGFVTLEIILNRDYTSILCNKHILITKNSLKKVAYRRPTFTRERTVPQIKKLNKKFCSVIFISTITTCSTIQLHLLNDSEVVWVLSSFIVFGPLKYPFPTSGNAWTRTRQPPAPSHGRF